MHVEICQQQVAADPRHDRRHAAPHARHVPLGPAKADKSRRVVDVDVSKIPAPDGFKEEKKQFSDDSEAIAYLLSQYP